MFFWLYLAKQLYHEKGAQIKFTAHINGWKWWVNNIQKENDANRFISELRNIIGFSFASLTFL